MSRRRQKTEAASHERWLVSYADFVTLLFAFFVVLFATGQTDRQRAKQVADSLKEGFSEPQLARAMSRMIGGPVKKLKDSNPQSQPNPTGSTALQNSADEQTLETAFARLQQLLKHRMEDRTVDLKMDVRGLVISLREQGFFVSGDDQIPASAKETIDQIASVIGPLPHRVRLEGHTDSIPIATFKYRDNWALSSARSIAMLYQFTDRRVDGQRFSVVGHGDTQPLASNETDEGRRQNRRVEIVVLTDQAELTHELPP
jgi:chemotaxis protein MotB